ncbi:TAP-like protein-domain-containing protein [Aspergillus pseudoustus]|uniref:TAP-like protein-domain-containing protein n=1 Tax=Aspergillus pseudoustus TaxID=1810923 RepID=A0ABR4K965_9EURO
MHPFYSLSPVLTLAFSLAAEAHIQWSPCNATEFNATKFTTKPLIFECATLDVPYDYTQPNSSETLPLELLRVPAQLQSRGSILFNLGGPGLPGRQGFIQAVATFIPLTGGEYDLVIFDTRGTGETIPLQCTEDPIEQFGMYKAQVLGNSSENAVGTLWARGAIDAATCYANAMGKKDGSVMTTAFTARDMIQIVDALEEDGMLRYWGLSYGTTLGATVTAMFPERVDKVILDGVQNPHEYFHVLGNPEEWLDSDKAFSQVFEKCVEAGPKLCPLAAHNISAKGLETIAWDLLDKLKTKPIAVGEILLDYGGFKSIFAQVLYSARNWPLLTAVVDSLVFGTKNPLATLFSNVPALSPDPATRDEALADDKNLMGIYCGDNQVRFSSFHDFLPTVHKLYSLSRVMGDIGIGSYSRCAQWKIKPKETYTGPFEAQTKNPILLIGNTLDGHTPLKSAYNVSQGYEGSVVLEVNGNGHASTSVPSKCTLAKVSAYWLNSTLPEPGTVCASDAPPFTDIWWPDVFKEAGVDDVLFG